MDSLRGERRLWRSSLGAITSKPTPRRARRAREAARDQLAVEGHRFKI
jgi:hypothetical protein